MCLDSQGQGTRGRSGGFFPDDIHEMDMIVSSKTESIFKVRLLVWILGRSALVDYFCNFAVFCFVAGKGAMAEVSTIVSVVQQYLQKQDESSQTACTSTSQCRCLWCQRQIENNMLTCPHNQFVSQPLSLDTSIINWVAFNVYI